MPRSKRRDRRKPKSPSTPKGDLSDTHENGSDSEQSEGETSDMEGATMEEMIQSLCKGMKKINTNFKEVKKELSSIKTSIATNYEQLNGKLNEYVEQNAELETKLEAANEEIETLTACNRELYLESEKVKDEKRTYNVIIRGVPEVDKEKIYETMNDLFALMQNSFAYISTHGAVRIGKVPSQQMPKPGQGNQRTVTQPTRPRPPRPIKLYCATRLQKGELFRNAQKLRADPKYPRVSISSDLTDDQMIAYKEVQLIHNVASKMPNVVSKMKGSAIEIDGKTYQKQDFANLPHGITLENASTILKDDGIMFASHCSPLSNLYKCQIVDGDTVYNSAEQRIVHKLAKLSGDRVVATKVMIEENPYKIKNLSKQIRKSKDWSIEKEKEFVRGSILMKFEQHTKLRNKIIRTKATQFYEATYDPLYGAGFNISDVHNGHTTPKPSCENFTGGVLTELKTKYHKQGKK